MSVEFHPLTISEIRAETDEAVSIVFDVPPGLRDSFGHVPGQHLVLRAEIDGDDVRRLYSICSAPGDPSLRVGIKRIPNGVFSTYATTALSPGDVVEVMTPIGDFGSACSKEHTKSYVMVAAGSGITPILSMVTAILRDEPGSEVTLLYGNRTTQTIMFHEDIEALKNRYHARLQVVHVLSREPHQVPLFQGRIDAEKLRLLAETLIDVPGIDDWYVCGPLEMVESLTGQLEELGVPADQVHSELFFDERIDTVPEVSGTIEGLVETTVTLDGRTSVVRVDPNGPSLLDYARSVRAEVPFACKGGMCATCKAVTIEGDVAMDKNYALTADEVEAGYILTCQAHPTGSGPVAISYDVHGGMGR